MALQLKTAQKFIKPLKVLLYGPTTSGKTLSSIKIATGIIMEIRKCTEAEAFKHMVLIDTEYGRGALHKKEGPYNYLTIDAPYSTTKLSNMILELDTMPEIDVIIIDSLTHFWVKEGGILDLKALKDKEGGNSYTNWQEYTGIFNKMMDIILGSPKHILVTSRAKSEVVLEENDRGKKVPKEIGIKPELRDNINFDFDLVFNIDKDTHSIIVEKPMPDMEDYYTMATPDFGKYLYNMMMSDAVVPVKTKDTMITNIKILAKTHNLIQFVQLALSGRKLDEMTSDELKTLEESIIMEVKKMQIRRK